jgi:hypothetical protein
VSDFLAAARPLPGSVAYAAVIGAPAFAGALDARRADCLSAAWDGWVPASSADLGAAGIAQGAVRAISSARAHADLGNDLTSVLCGLNPHCLVIRTSSSVELSIVAPDGRRISRTLSEIPGATFRAPQGNSGDWTTIVLPVTPAGEYRIDVGLRPGESPDALYTLEILEGARMSGVANERVSTTPQVIYTLAPQ